MTLAKVRIQYKCRYKNRAVKNRMPGFSGKLRIARPGRSTFFEIPLERENGGGLCVKLSPDGPGPLKRKGPPPTEAHNNTYVLTVSMRVLREMHYLCIRNTWWIKRRSTTNDYVPDLACKIICECIASSRAEVCTSGLQNELSISISFKSVRSKTLLPAPLAA